MPKLWIVLACVLVALPASAQQRVTFAWDAPSSADATGYSLQIGAASGQTTQEQNVGQTLTTAYDFAPGTYFVRIVAYNLAGFSSASNELRIDVATNPPPPPPPPPPCDPPTVTAWPTQKKNANQLRYTSTWTVSSVTINGHGQTVESATFTGSGCTITVLK